MIVKITTLNFAKGFGLFGDINELKENIANCSDEEVEKAYRSCAFLRLEFPLETVLQYYLETSQFDRNLAEKRMKLDDEIIAFLKNTVTNRKIKKLQNKLCP
ncbi:MAG: hypothetical protein E7019_05550 [Alphaproteobacteria bacterium]|nr:hypothetical protein [Alphaproteobacteria bacterium]